VFKKSCETMAFQYSSIRQIKTETKMVCSIDKSVAAIMGAARIFFWRERAEYLLRGLI
jgi:hypothetical protein